ncbi:hypothetical protein LEN26_002461 [Aphanomyces euteiches]|nr:hypothetical protein AeMF1_015341 [Aphanomyces euteiches]KAH9159202.1 hypothetical protein LEN26_002461 [Aphanomyces euteiches]
MAKEKWRDGETNSLIAYWEDHFEGYKRLKTPFYEAAAQTIGTKSAKSVKNRCEHLERKYVAIKEKMNASGFGVRDNDPPTLRATITKELKWYYELDEILGSTAQIRTQALVDTSRPSTLTNVNEQESDSVGIESIASPAVATSSLEDGKRVNSNSNKRKASESITEVLLSLGERSFELERGRLELKQRQFDFDVRTRLEEMEQRRREFEMMHQTAKAQYDLDKMTLEAKIRKLGGTN